MPPACGLPTSAACRKRLPDARITRTATSWTPRANRPADSATMMLDDRAKSLLKTLVERYIADGQPVGSRTLSRASGLELSPATIRNVMADLEELGLIASPHTSAGRIPTARGYRLFVDTMLTAQPPSDRCRRRRARAAAARPAAARDRATRRSCCRTCRSSSAWSPRREPQRCSATSSSCGCRERRVLVIIVSPDGDVQNRVIVTAHDYTPVAAGRGHQLPQRALRRADDRGGARAPEAAKSRRCAARSPR